MKDNPSWDDVAKNMDYIPEQIKLPYKNSPAPIIRSNTDSIVKFEGFINDFEQSCFAVGLEKDELDEKKEYQDFVNRGKVILAQWIKINNCLKGEDAEKSYIKPGGSFKTLEGLKILEITGDEGTKKELEEFGAEVSVLSPYGKNPSKSREESAQLMAGALKDIVSTGMFDLINIDRHNLYYAFATDKELEDSEKSKGLEEIIRVVRGDIYRGLTSFGKLTTAQPKIAVEAFIKKLSK
jgi:hypothetical protein